MNNYIQDREGNLWSRKQKEWIEPSVWTSWSPYRLQVECAFKTYRGCNQVAGALWRKGFDTYQWGAIKLDPIKQVHA